MATLKGVTGSILKTVASQLSSVILGRGKADIVLTAEGMGDRVIFPVIPAELPKLNSPQNNDTFKGVNTDLSVIGNMGLRSISWEGMLPYTLLKYSFTRPYGSTASDVINFIKRYQDEAIVLRLTIVFTDGTVYVNMPCLVNNFEYWRNNVGDFKYRIDLIEYRIVTESALL